MQPDGTLPVREQTQMKMHIVYTQEWACPTSLRREAQQVCLIFQTTAATSNNDRKQLERGERCGYIKTSPYLFNIFTQIDVSIY